MFLIMALSHWLATVGTRTGLSEGATPDQTRMSFSRNVHENFHHFLRTCIDLPYEFYTYLFIGLSQFFLL